MESNKLEYHSRYAKEIRKAQQGVRNVNFSEDFAYVLNEWPPEVQQKII